MKNEIVEVVGIYQLEKECIKDYDELLNPENAENAVIIEMVIKKPLREINICEITQADESLPKSDWQTVYGEVFLDESGTEILCEKDVRDAGYETTRFVFFFHYLDFGKPIQTPYGDVSLTKLARLPKRLEGKIKYWEP